MLVPTPPLRVPPCPRGQAPQRTRRSRRSQDLPPLVKTSVQDHSSVGRVPADPPPEWALAHARVVGERIRVARRDAGLSQVQLGERIGRDHKTVHRWEAAATAPGLIDLLLVADALDTPVAHLVDRPAAGPRG
ncbi:helix-turn-helix transcriptional regulator [Streptomyces sp. NPDC096080]|uniref:helix-turn-helix domain-containing protein n=1 Tax=Streptomyces sp. NPDC096080 TaxID=3156693 RepID=UPI00332A5FCA